MNNYFPAWNGFVDAGLIDVRCNSATEITLCYIDYYGNYVNTAMHCPDNDEALVSFIRDTQRRRLREGGRKMGEETLPKKEVEIDGKTWTAVDLHAGNK